MRHLWYRWQARRRSVTCPVCVDVISEHPCSLCGLWGHVSPRVARRAVRLLLTIESRREAAQIDGSGGAA